MPRQASVDTVADTVEFLKETITGKVPLTVQKCPRKITVMKDTLVEFPQLYLSVYLEGPINDCAGFAEMFARTGSHRVREPDKADLVVFTGGSDVDPALYNQKPHSSTYFNTQRDTDCIDLYLHCVENGIPMFGVCRGAQFLHVMNGGTLFQDVDNHNGDHSIWALREGVHISHISSVHHQMVMPNIKNGMEILATASRSQKRYVSPTLYESGNNTDIEGYFYRDTCCIGVQGHPEYRGYAAYTKWCLEVLDKLVVCNPDLDWIGATRRMKQSLIDQRGLGWSVKNNQVMQPSKKEVN